MVLVGEVPAPDPGASGHGVCVACLSGGARHWVFTRMIGVGEGEVNDSSNLTWWLLLFAVRSTASCLTSNCVSMGLRSDAIHELEKDPRVRKMGILGNSYSTMVWRRNI